MDNLPLLRDIHLPHPVDGFPLGYGWLLLPVLLILAFLLYRVFLYLRIKSRRYYALNLLKSYTDSNLNSARQISELLRRICVYKYKTAASLLNQEWITFLNEHSKNKITGKAAELLIYAPFMKDGSCFDQNDYETLSRFAKNWIGENL